MKKKITIIGVNYYPEDTAIGLYTSQLAEFLAINNYEVTVVTGFPYYPSWRIHEEYRRKNVFLTEYKNEITIFRYKQYVPSNPTFFKRIIHLLDFTFGSLINLSKVKSTDAVLCIVPFTSAIFLGKILSKLKRAKLWVHVQDFEFDAASDSDLTNNKSKTSIFFKILFWVEKKLLKSADLRSTISVAMLKKLESKCPNKKSILLPNWVDINDINLEKSKRHPHLNTNKFKILYSGNIGEKQDWEFFLRFAKSIKKNPNIEIIIIGDGSKKRWLEKRLINFSNVILHPPVAYSELSDLLCSADLHFLFQKDDVIDTVMPSKILAMMASQKPSLITGNLNSEVATIIKNSKAGDYFHSTDLINIIKFVECLEKDLSLREKFGINARKYATKNFSRDEILTQFKTTLESLTS